MTAYASDSLGSFMTAKARSLRGVSLCHGVTSYGPGSAVAMRNPAIERGAIVSISGADQATLGRDRQIPRAYRHGRSDKHQRMLRKGRVYSVGGTALQAAATQAGRHNRRETDLRGFALQRPDWKDTVLWEGNSL